MTRRAIRKRLRRKFRAGDLVTWGLGLVWHPVLRVERLGVVVDTTSSGVGRQEDGRLVMLIEFAPGSRSRRCPGPPRRQAQNART